MPTSHDTTVSRKPERIMQMALRMPESMWRELKLRSLDSKTPASEIIREALRKHLKIAA